MSAATGGSASSTGAIRPRTYACPETAVSVTGSTGPSSPSGLRANAAPPIQPASSATPGPATERDALPWMYRFNSPEAPPNTGTMRKFSRWGSRLARNSVHRATCWVGPDRNGTRSGLIASSSAPTGERSPISVGGPSSPAGSTSSPNQSEAAIRIASQPPITETAVTAAIPAAAWPSDHPIGVPSASSSTLHPSGTTASSAGSSE
ncbi:hypothetical protein SY89_02283 [Halolamina pelagica]|uniref:Uncharacterized protein n=1 Tax=Halolamina pelagica TaxID=699431 RepID=A0A0P7GQR0_9EURY|nr:hypothetical protein SY89_02283 [Halolamina pelagica]